MNEYLSPQQAADMLGLSKRTILRWIADGKLPAQKVTSHTIRIRREDLDAIIHPRSVESVAAEIENYVAIEQAGIIAKADLPDGPPEGEMLDRWLTLWGLSRREGESDLDARKRLADRVARPDGVDL